jgi:hypothetical protein
MPEALRRAHGATALVERGGEAVNTNLDSSLPVIGWVVPPVSTLGEVADHFRQCHFSIMCLEATPHRDPDPALRLGVARPFHEEIRIATEIVALARSMSGVPAETTQHASRRAFFRSG